MKAVRFHAYGGPDVLTFESAPEPVPAPHEVLIRVAAAGVNPLDWKVRSGGLARAMPLSLPVILGWDVAGKVAGRGEQVSDFQIGDAVFGMIPVGAPGAYAELVVAPVDALVKRPPDLSPAQAGVLPVVGLTAWQLIHQAGQTQPGETVMVLGAAGQVGRLSATFAGLISEVHVLAAARAAALARVSLPSEAREVAMDTPSWAEKAAEANVIIDTVGGEPLRQAMGHAKSGTRIVSTVQPPDPELARAQRLSASMFRVRPDGAAVRQIAELAAQGTLRLPQIDSFPLKNAARAHEAGEAGTHRKLVLEVP